MLPLLVGSPVENSDGEVAIANEENVIEAEDLGNPATQNT